MPGDLSLNRETELQNRIRLALCEKFPGIVLWRNSIGFDARAKVYYGLGGSGGSDLIGMYRGRFVALEIKVKGGEKTAEQINFVKVIKEGGGVAGFVHSIEEAVAVIVGAA